MNEPKQLSHPVDALIVGGGPAGAATALALARAGATAVVLERSEYQDVRLGETVPPRIREPLAALGIAPGFLDQDHAPSYANASAWGSTSLEYQDFLFNPLGHGWHLARNVFDRQLAMAAAAAGATVFLGTRLGRLERCASGWRAEASSRGRAVSLIAKLLVDATGRGSIVARRLGHQPVVEDRLVGLAGYLHEGEPEVERTLLLEAMEGGWWYSAPLPGYHVAVYMTDADLLPRSKGLCAFWQARLLDSHHTRQRLAGCGAVDRLTARPAQSFVLDRPTGPGFLAVGDAACAFDPLSSGGIHKALRSGLEAARTLLGHLDGQAEALDEYDSRVRAEYGRYLELRAEYYSMETRWPGSTFWRRRRDEAP